MCLGRCALDHQVDPASDRSFLSSERGVDLRWRRRQRCGAFCLQQKINAAKYATHRARKETFKYGQRSKSQGCTSAIQPCCNEEEVQARVVPAKRLQHVHIWFCHFVFVSLVRSCYVLCVLSFSDFSVSPSLSLSRCMLGCRRCTGLTFAVACVQGDRALSMGSHMQQDMVTSSAFPHPSAPAPSFAHCVTRN